MARKLIEVNPHQGSLLHDVDAIHTVAGEHFPNDPIDKLMGDIPETRVIYGEPGSYVRLEDRARHLNNALKAFGFRNQRLGFDVASNTRQYNPPIYARYRQNVPRVQEGAAANADKYLDAAKESFWHATGYQALRGTGLAPRDELDSGARKMWREFSSAYGDPGKKEDRDEYRKTLKRSAKTSQAVLRRAREV